MATNLYWATPSRRDRVLGYQLKFILAPRLWEHDGSLGSDHTPVGRDLIPFLEGVVAATGVREVKAEAQKLIDLIERYGEVEIWLEG